MSLNYPYDSPTPPLPSGPSPYGPPASLYGPPAPPPPYGTLPPPPKRPGRTWAIGIGSAVVTAALVIGGVALANTGSAPVAGSGSLAELLPSGGSSSSAGNGSGSNGSGGNVLPGSGGGPLVPGNGNQSGGGNSTGNGTSTTAATAKQQVGIVTVVSVLKYQSAESAGTGMILTSDGEILTNNHVINGATSVTVTVESTGKSYRAAVVGTSPTNDVAVLQLANASGLPTANISSGSAAVAVGDSVTGVGNGGGTGTLTAAAGTVTGLNQSITASDETGQNSERLTDLIQIDAGIIAGDSGGPLYNSSGKIIGMDTAASAGRAATSAYAIKIENATKIADEIEAGVETTSIHIGYPGFLGIGVADTTGGAAVNSLLQGGPAAAAGITKGSVITRIDATTITSADSLRSVLTGEKPGTKVTVTWTDSTGSSHTATVTLATGPAD